MNTAGPARLAAGDPGILDGLRVIDLCTGLAGSAAALALSEAGADVLKLSTRGTAEEVLFRVLDRGKRRMPLDPHRVDHCAILDTWLARADVLLHDFTPAQALALGLDDERLTARNPALIVAPITGWPARHPLADAPGRETLVLARLGILDEQPGHRAGPVFIRMPFASWIASGLCAVGVMARLLARDRDGRGGVVRTSLAQAALVPMTMHWARAEKPSPAFAKGLDKTLPIPLHQASDGRWIHVHYSPDAAPWMAEGLAAMGPVAVAQANAEFPPSHVAPNFGANRRIIATRPAQAWADHFWAYDVAAQPAAEFGAIYGDEQAQANGYVVMVQDPQLGATLQPGPAIAVQPPARVRGPLQALSMPDPSIWPERPVPLSTWHHHAHDQPLQAPLEGLNVLDLGAYLAGPFACMLLADLGADVIKVEPPGGDAMRRLERAFAGTQRGKRGLALKLGTPAAQPVLQALADWADVVHHNVRLPAARKLGIAPEQLCVGRPQLVCTHVSAYGPSGRRADWPGFDQLMQAACGWEIECGGAGNPPMWLRFGVGDHLAALSSVFATLLALYQRHRTGQGQAVASSLLGAMLMAEAEVVVKPDGGLTAMAHLDRDQCGLSATHRLYRCSDGWLAVQAQGEVEQAAFEHTAAPDATAWAAARARDEAVAILRQAGVACEPLLEAQAKPFLADADHAAAGLHAHSHHAQYGALQQVGQLWDFGDLPLAIGRPPPALGEHSVAVLQQLGWPPEAIDALMRSGVSCQWSADTA